MLTLENTPTLAKLLVDEEYGNATGAELVAWAQDALEAGFESPSLVRLASEEPPFFTPDLRRRFCAAADELGMERVTFEQARVFYAQQVARQMIANSATHREIAEGLARIFFAHNTSPPFNVWWLLDEAFTAPYTRAGIELRGRVLDDAIEEELKNLVEFEWRWATDRRELEITFFTSTSVDMVDTFSDVSEDFVVDHFVAAFPTLSALARILGCSEDECLVLVKAIPGSKAEIRRAGERFETSLRAEPQFLEKIGAAWAREACWSQKPNPMDLVGFLLTLRFELLRRSPQPGSLYLWIERRF